MRFPWSTHGGAVGARFTSPRADQSDGDAMTELEKLRTENAALKNTLGSVEVLLASFIDTMANAAKVMNSIGVAVQDTYPDIASEALEVVDRWNNFLDTVEKLKIAAALQNAPTTGVRN